MIHATRGAAHILARSGARRMRTMENAGRNAWLNRCGFFVGRSPNDSGSSLETVMPAPCLRLVVRHPVDAFQWKASAHQYVQFGESP
jgi:hypothetical protein